MAAVAGLIWRMTQAEMTLTLFSGSRPRPHRKCACCHCSHANVDSVDFLCRCVLRDDQLAMCHVSLFLASNLVSFRLYEDILTPCVRELFEAYFSPGAFGAQLCTKTELEI